MGPINHTVLGAAPHFSLPAEQGHGPPGFFVDNHNRGDGLANFVLTPVPFVPPVNDLNEAIMVSEMISVPSCSVPTATMCVASNAIGPLSNSASGCTTYAVSTPAYSFGSSFATRATSIIEGDRRFK